MVRRFVGQHGKVAHVDAVADEEALALCGLRMRSERRRRHFHRHNREKTGGIPLILPILAAGKPFISNRFQKNHHARREQDNRGNNRKLTGRELALIRAITGGRSERKKGKPGAEKIAHEVLELWSMRMGSRGEAPAISPK